jgi:hypothetical protein
MLSPVKSVHRLVTFADLNDRHPGGAVSARLVAELSDGCQIVLLDDRGCSSSLGVTWETTETVEFTARVVVGPDEPAREETHAQMETRHWEWLERKLEDAGVSTDAAELRTLLPDVVISDRLRPLLRSSSLA